MAVIDMLLRYLVVVIVFGVILQITSDYLTYRQLREKLRKKRNAETQEADI